MNANLHSFILFRNASVKCKLFKFSPKFSRAFASSRCFALQKNLMNLDFTDAFPKLGKICSFF